MEGMVSKVLGTWFRAWGAWYREYEVPSFERTGYMVSEVLGYREGTRTHFSKLESVLPIYLMI